MTGIPENFGEGHFGLAPYESQGTPTLASILRALAGSSAGNVPAWQDGITVTTHVAILPKSGFVFAVHATAGTAPGPKSQISTGTPGAGEVKVEYDSLGVPTLTFAVADAITTTSVTQMIGGEDLLP